MTAPPAAPKTPTARRRTTEHAATDDRADARPEAAPQPHGRPDEPAHDETPGRFWREWRWWLPVSSLALALALLFVDPFAGDWDALDYAVLAVRGEPSTMLFGRMLFIFTNHLAYQIAHALFGLRPEDSYLLFKYMVVGQSPLAVAAVWLLARDVTGSVRAATVAALLLAVSPFFVIYSGQAMTEIPSLLLLASALAVHLRGLRKRRLWLVLLGAALLGTGNNVREVAALYGVWLVLGPFACGWKFRGRDLLITAAACAIFWVCAFAPWLYYYLGDVGGYRAGWHGWVESMRSEEAVHPVSARNFLPLFFFFYIGAPLVVAGLAPAAWSEWRRRGLSPALALAGVGLFANLMLVTHYSTVINGRYLMTGLPGIVPLVADFFVRYEARRTGGRRRGFVVAACGVLFTALVFGAIFFPASWQTIKSHGLTKEYRARLALVPRDAVMIAGGQTVSVNYYRGTGLGEWDVIGTGGGWPTGRLAEVIEGHLKQGRRVFLDADPRFWFNDSWRSQETRELVEAGARFRYRRVSQTIYEVRPPEDASAQDDPNLHRLLERPPTRMQKLRDRL
jgi:Dolichyl-phosphate-mannose-protein mannosyltransferase